MKTLHSIVHPPSPHWVGDGFPVRSIFTYTSLGREMSPFLLMDYAGPIDFPPSPRPRGVGEHPHRGFETVTIVYSGDVQHRDSSGGGGIIGPGDVQWMTAAAGLVHEEFHGPQLAQHGGRLEMIQLWVNLPAKDKMAPPAYQSIDAAQIPHVGPLRIIAGSHQGIAGPARTFTPINLWDARLPAGQRLELELPSGHTSALFVLKGGVRFPNGESAAEASLAIFNRDGDRIGLEALDDTMLLVLDGQPIDEPISGHGPFVMNTRAEILQAIDDYQSGRMGRLPGV